ncbi:unnamed protein product [Candidatus Paraburkholderia kirkii UZHbot1]|uniref:WGS project CAFE00000000 data, contig bkir_c107 n=1 Tax=Candidatus Paraburkholderia kirkii UZHbot1 TaxID=1055526 RepID=M5ET63_9BURK|nr:unnamed protein product [Candidatus Paraburkholderia kirkii UZHbot1]
MTKHELSEKAGISISFLSDLTNGKANPSLKIMEAIAEALSVPLTLHTLDDIAGGKSTQGLPPGYERVFAVYCLNIRRSLSRNGASKRKRSCAGIDSTRREGRV